MARRGVFTAIVLGALVVVSAGCATRVRQVQGPTSKSDMLAAEAKATEALAQDDKHVQDLVDQQLRLGSMALDVGDNVTARKALSDATGIIAGAYSSKDFTRRADKAMKAFNSEDTKYFLGDPYEQMFAFIYLGILDFQAGDYELARASFRSAQRSDEGTLLEGYRSDCYLAFLLEGVASRALGDAPAAEDAFNFAQKAYTFRQRLSVVTRALYLGLGAMKPEKATARDLEVLDRLFPVVYSRIPGSLWTDPEPSPTLVAAFQLARDGLTQPEGGKLEKHSDEAGLLKAIKGKNDVDKAMELLKSFEQHAQENLHSEDLDRAKKSEAEFGKLIELCRNPKVNTFVLIEDGQGPTKIRHGRYGDVVDFYVPADPTRHTIASLRKGEEPAAPVVLAQLGLLGESTAYQARTRGGREMDSILRGKVQFRDTMNATSAIASGVASAALVAATVAATTLVTTTVTTVTYTTTATGAVTATTTTTSATAPAGMAAAGPALAVAGVGVALYQVSKMIADATHPEGDIRGWHELPGQLHLLVAAVEPGKYHMDVQCFDKLGQALTSGAKSVNFEAVADKPVLVLCPEPWH